MTKHWIFPGNALDVLPRLPKGVARTCVTSPPYWGLRDYGVDGQLGLEPTPDEYVAQMVAVFRMVREVLADDGTLWLNLGDSYAGSGQNSGSTLESLTEKQRSNAGCRFERLPIPDGLKRKDLIGIPWRVAFALQADGWYLRQDIIWAKPNPMPESVRDRCTKSHEYIFMLSKNAKYFYDADAIKEPALYPHDDRKGRAKTTHKTAPTTQINGIRADKQRGHSAGFNDRRDAMEEAAQCSGMRNKRSVWTIAPKPFKGSHFATFPPALIEPCVLAGSPIGGVVIDPFSGAGTTGLVALQQGRKYIGIELNPEYITMTQRRFAEAGLVVEAPVQEAA